MSSEFSDLEVVVTGGTGALGSAVVARLLASGATCHVPCFAEKELAAFAHAGHERVRVVHPVDLTREDDVAAFYAGLPALWASIQVAGGFAMTPFDETPLADYERLMAMNATTAFLCCREAVRRIRQSGAKGGRLVNVAARPALEPRSGGGMVAYTMSKAAVAALTASLAQELAAERIWVNAVAPSILDTPANRSAMPDAPHDTWPKVDDVAATIVFLASPENRSSRGGVVPVYGGA
jgi:NAD(P)-dependent dehydrogenase (short-subunit alcohol dehydrogenase family)